MMKILYQSQATAIGGRCGSAASADGRLKVRLDLPKALGGDDRDGTNPEQLFAAGYAAAFLSAIKRAAAKEGIAIAPDSNVTATVALGEDEGPCGYRLKVTLSADLPDLDPATADRLIAAAYAGCPYSAAISDKLDVRIKAD
jgi:Ohr subfamily peroxiredoxin